MYVYMLLYICSSIYISVYMYMSTHTFIKDICVYNCIRENNKMTQYIKFISGMIIHIISNNGYNYVYFG